MKKAGKKLILVSLIAVSVLWSVPCFADNPFRELFEDAFYGGLAGTLVGGAVLAFTHKPGDHLDYLAYGAATGVIIGTTYGAVKATQSLAEYDRGHIRFAMPTVLPDISVASARGGGMVGFRTELLRGKF